MPTQAQQVAARAAYYSRLVYSTRGDVAIELEAQGLDWKWYDYDDTQALLVRDDPLGAFVSFRGTQFSTRFSWADVKSNILLRKTAWVMGGRVHRGYNEAIQDVSAELWADLQYIEGPLWYDGHSLGGVLATLMTSIPLTANRPHPTGTFTFGAPRAGHEAFNKPLVSPFVRYVYGADLAPMYPHTVLGYRHCRPPTWLNRQRFRFPSLADHSVDNYFNATQVGG